MGLGHLFAALGALTIAADVTTPVPAPAFSVGDQWVFDQTIERGSQGYDQRRLDLRIDRADTQTMLVGVKRDGSPGAYVDHVLGADWSIRRLIDGKEAPTARPFTFPMNVGQSWTVDYVDATKRGAQTSGHVRRTYQGGGWEDGAGPAGTFRAIKVDAAGIDQAVFSVPAVVTGAAADGTAVMRSQTGGTRPVTIKTHDYLYYVPSIKNYVKSVEEQYNSDDVLISRETRALVSFKPAA